MRSVIAFIKLSLYGLMCLLSIPVQSLLMLFTKGPAACVMPHWFQIVSCALFGITVKQVGGPARADHLVLLSNHLSYLDILAIGSLMPCSFVAKSDVAGWPLFGTLARLQQTVFISRDPRRAAEQTARFEEALDKPRPLILFPEGTSSEGALVLPYKSSLFEIFLKDNIKEKIILQPLTVRLESVNGQPAETSAIRDLYSWYGDMELVPHLWAFAKGKGAVVTILFHEAIDPATYNDRKILAEAAHQATSQGLAFAPLDAYNGEELISNQGT